MGKGVEEVITMGSFVSEFKTMARYIYEMAVEKGWYENGERNKGEMIALMHSELSEALEGLRHGNPPDEHCPSYSSAEIELADVIIRIMDFGEAFHLDIARAIEAKVAYNQTRPHRHGKEF